MKCTIETEGGKRVELQYVAAVTGSWTSGDVMLSGVKKHSDLKKR